MSDGMILSGQEYDRRHHVLLTYLQQSVDYSGPDSLRVTGAEGTAFLDQAPTDKDAALDKQWDIAAIQAAAIALAPYAVPTKVRVPLPDVLTSVTVAFNKTSGTGATNFPTSQQSFSTVISGSVGLNPHASAEASAAIIPIVTWVIDKYDTILVNATVYTFFSASSITLAGVLTRLSAANAANATVLSLPFFGEKQHQLKLFGQQVSLQATAQSRANVQYNSDTPPSVTAAVEYGDSYSEHVGVDVRRETIPYTIHDTISIASNTDTATVTVTVKADTIAITYAGGTLINAITNEPTPITLTANGSVTPNSLAATTPHDIPRTGLYLVDISGQPEEFGLNQIRAVVVDMSQYA